MSKITYEIVEHDGGWTYRAEGVWHDEIASGGDRPDTEVKG